MIPIRNTNFAKINYLAGLGVFGYYYTRVYAVDFRKYYAVSSVKRL